MMMSLGGRSEQGGRMSASSPRASTLHLTMLAMLCIPTTSTFGQTTEPPDVFEVPVKPGSPEWFALSPEERFESMQMPESVRKSISTEGLLESCLRFRLSDLRLALMSPDPHRRGVVRQLERRFNGFTELLSRTDAGRIVLARYRKLSVDGVPEWSEEDIRQSTWLQVLQALLGDSRVLSQLSVQETDSLLCAVLEKPRSALVRRRLDAWLSTAVLAEILTRRLEPARAAAELPPFPSKQAFEDARRALAASGRPTCTEQVR
jgi:hypothetical protein